MEKSGTAIDDKAMEGRTTCPFMRSALKADLLEFDGQTAPQALGQFQLARFVNKVGLESIGDNLFIETAASGPAIAAAPGAEGFGNLQQSYLEEANVNAVTEISSLIAAQRAYEMNSKVVTAADQMMSTTSQMFRG